MKASWFLGGIAAMLLAAGGAVAGEPAGKVQIIIDGQPVELKDRTMRPAPETAKLGEYWLGLMVAPLSDEQRKELKAPEGQGLVVQQVVPDSPAAKAKFQEKDVLLKAGEKPLASVDDLLAAVNEAKEKPLGIVLLREGKEQTVQVAPAKRPAVQGGDLEHLQKLFGHVEELIEGEGGPRVFRFHAFGPGAILPRGATLPADVLIQRPLPDDMSVTISKTGKKPAEIAVKQGDEKWEGTEEQLDKMPAKFRPYVERMLGRWPMAVGAFGGAAAADGGVGGAGGGLGGFNVRVLPPQPGEFVPKVLAERVVAPLDKRIEERLDRMNERIDKLFKMLEERREGRKIPPKDAEKKPVEM